MLWGIFQCESDTLTEQCAETHFVVCIFDMLEQQLGRVVKARCYVLRNILGVYTSDMLEEELGRAVKARCYALVSCSGQRHILGVYICVHLK